MSPLQILRERLRAIISQASNTESGQGGGRVQVVSAEVLEDTAKTYKNCHCDELGLVPGFPVDQLIELESGCTTKNFWVCPRLDAVRRRYGK